MTTHLTTKANSLSKFDVETEQVNDSQLLLARQKEELEAVNERLRLEVYERKQVQADLERSEMRLSTLMGNLQGMAFRCADDQDWTMIFVSQGCLDLTGYQPAEFVENHRISFACLIHPDDREAVHEGVHAAVCAGEPWKLEYRIRRKNGDEVWGLDQGCAVFSAQGDIEGLEGFILDITQQKRAEQALEEVNAYLQKSNADLEQFAFIASHDLKSPLNAITKLVSWIEEDMGEDIPKSSRQHLKLLRGRSNRMTKLLDDLLSYSRVGLYGFDTEPVQLKQSAENNFSLLDTSNQFFIEAQDFELQVARIPFELVLRNMISNAVKHHDSDAGIIQVSCEKQGNNYQLRIQDDGPGIPPDMHDKAREMFQPLKPRDTTEGSGMGLALANRIVQHYDGDLSIDSDGKRGTVVVITWPAPG